jgi:hypothetical protein
MVLSKDDLSSTIDNIIKEKNPTKKKSKDHSPSVDEMKMVIFKHMITRPNGKIIVKQLWDNRFRVNVYKDNTIIDSVFCIINNNNGVLTLTER